MYAVGYYPKHSPILSSLFFLNSFLFSLTAFLYAHPQGDAVPLYSLRFEDTYLILFCGWNLVSRNKFVPSQCFLSKHNVIVKIGFVFHLCCPVIFIKLPNLSVFMFFYMWNEDDNSAYHLRLWALNK